jgi:hypothetical protein
MIMELDDLKQTWKKKTNQKPYNKTIMEMIQHKSYGPIAALKRSYRKQILLMLLMPFFLLAMSGDDMTKPLSSDVLDLCRFLHRIGRVLHQQLYHRKQNAANGWNIERKS